MLIYKMSTDQLLFNWYLCFLNTIFTLAITSLIVGSVAFIVSKLLKFIVDEAKQYEPNKYLVLLNNIMKSGTLTTLLPIFTSYMLNKTKDEKVEIEQLRTQVDKVKAERLSEVMKNNAMKTMINNARNNSDRMVKNGKLMYLIKSITDELELSPEQKRQINSAIYNVIICSDHIDKMDKKKLAHIIESLSTKLIVLLKTEMEKNPDLKVHIDCLKDGLVNASCLLHDCKDLIPGFPLQSLIGFIKKYEQPKKNYNVEAAFDDDGHHIGYKATTNNIPLQNNTLGGTLNPIQNNTLGGTKTPIV
jgi:hypothetical protein